MSTVAHSGRLMALLHHLPSSWLAALDAWSYRVAQNHRERRRRAALRARMPAAAPINYTLKPWRD